MTCDDFFEMLTSSKSLCVDGRGHLERCPRCRDLQEALFPAISELNNDARKMHSQSLPSQTRDWNQQRSSSTESSQAAVQAVRQLQASSVLKPNRSHPSRWRYVAAFVAGAVASLGIAAVLRSEPTMSALQANSVCLWQHRQDDQEEMVSSNDVILSCVGCHLSNPGTGSL